MTSLRPEILLASEAEQDIRTASDPKSLLRQIQAFFSSPPERRAMSTLPGTDWFVGEIGDRAVLFRSLTSEEVRQRTNTTAGKAKPYVLVSRVAPKDTIVTPVAGSPVGPETGQ